jgi:formate dehydrogenase subunit delta
MGEDSLVRVANQIADFFRNRPEPQAVDATADHIRKYWEPRMRAKMAQHLARGGDGLKPIARAAAERACQPAKAKTVAATRANAATRSDLTRCLSGPDDKNRTILGNSSA